MAEVWNGANKVTVEFQTNDKICISLYVPTGSTIDGYQLLKNGTILEVTVLTHKLMWEPNGIQLSLQESTAIQDGYDSNQMRARKRFMSEAIRANIMKDGYVQNENKFEVSLKHVYLQKNLTQFIFATHLNTLLKTESSYSLLTLK